MSVTTPAEIPTPGGYRRVPWEQAYCGQQVWLLGVRELPHATNPAQRVLHPAAYGPYVVIERHKLWNLGEGRSVQEPGERLLVSTEDAGEKEKKNA